MNYLKPLATLDFWFNLSPAPIVGIIFNILGILILVVLVVGIAFRVWAHRVRKNPPLHRILVRVGRMAVTLALVAMLFYFFNYEELYALSARFWWALLLIGAIVWKVFIIRDFLTRYPMEKKANEERLRREKYLPK